MEDRFVRLSELGSVRERSIDVNGEDFIINWQVDLVGNTGRTFAQVFGNELSKAIVASDDGSGFITPFECNLSYNINNDKTINQVKIQNILLPGKLIFI